MAKDLQKVTLFFLGCYPLSWKITSPFAGLWPMAHQWRRLCVLTVYKCNESHIKPLLSFKYQGLPDTWIVVTFHVRQGSLESVLDPVPSCKWILLFHRADWHCCHYCPHIHSAPLASMFYCPSRLCSRTSWQTWWGKHAPQYLRTNFSILSRAISSRKAVCSR